MNTFLELAKERYSVRKFSNQPIKDADLQKIFEAAKVAPTAHNNQPVRIYVLKSDAAITKANSICNCIYGAETVLLIAYDADTDWKNPLEEGIHSGQQDASIVATHIMMEAADLGLSTCWVNFFSNAKASEVFELPKNIVPVLMMPIGYASEDAKPAPLHSAYPGEEQMVIEL